MLDFSKPNEELDLWIEESLMSGTADHGCGRYSESISSAFEIVRKHFLKDGFYFDLAYDSGAQVGKWNCDVVADKFGGTVYAGAETPELAICKAAYVAKTRNLI